MPSFLNNFFSAGELHIHTVTAFPPFLFLPLLLFFLIILPFQELHLRVYLSLLYCAIVMSAQKNKLKKECLLSLSSAMMLEV